MRYQGFHELVLCHVTTVKAWSRPSITAGRPPVREVEEMTDDAFAIPVLDVLDNRPYSAATATA